MRAEARGRVVVGIAVLGVAFAGIGLAGCRVDYPASVLDPAGPAARMELDLLRLSLYVVGAVSIAVFLALAYVLVRFRARPGDDAEGDDNPGITWLELTWTIVPALLLVILAVPSLTDTFHLARVPAGAMKMTVIGHQFWWEFRYDQLGIVTANEPHIPAGRPLDLRVTSADVIHQFWVPRLGAKMDAAPGRRNFLWMQSDRPGVIPGLCTQLCGASHSLMLMTVYADSAKDFGAWAQAMKKPFVAPAAGTEAAAGMAVFAAKCATCHAIGGTNYKGVIGPNLTGLMLRRTIGAGLLKNTPENLRRWVTDASVFKPGVKMPSARNRLGLNDAQIRAVVAFLETLR